MNKEILLTENKLALSISILLHPLFMAIYGISLLFVYTDFKFLYSGQFSRFFTPILLFSCVIPAISLYLLKKGGYINSYALESRGERYLPFLITFFSYVALLFYFYKALLPLWFLGTILVPILLLVICSIITNYWKISAHMVAIGGLIGSVLSICYNIKGENPYILFMILIILAGLLAVSRLVLNRHTPAQIYVGFLVGLSVSYITLWTAAYWTYLYLIIYYWLYR